MSLPFVYTPRPGEYVRVSRDGASHCLIATCGSESGTALTVRILPDEVPGVAAGIATAMHEAAGLPAPVILERPEIVPDGDGETGINIFTVRLEPNLRSVSIRYHGAPNRAIIAPGPARVLASVIAAYADMAQAHQDEPDPAEVEELAEAIRTAHHPDSGRSGDGDRTAARTALRWFRDKQQREGDVP